MNKNPKLNNNCHVIVDRYKENVTYRYDLVLLKEKEENKYRIINLTRGHICICKFTSIEEAFKDILDYEKKGLLKILDVRY